MYCYVTVFVVPSPSGHYAHLIAERCVILSALCNEEETKFCK